MELTSILAWLPSLISAATAYLKSNGVTTAQTKAAEVVGERAGAAVADTGQQVLKTLQAHFTRKADTKAKQALAHVVLDPDDEDYRNKLIKETARLAASDEAFARELSALAQSTQEAARSEHVTISNTAPNHGVQGIIHGSVIMGGKE